jgi:hypothetical protein
VGAAAFFVAFFGDLGFFGAAALAFFGFVALVLAFFGDLGFFGEAKRFIIQKK